MIFKGTISKALGSSYSSLEEGKADVMGVYNILYMIQRGELSEDLREKSLVTYVAGLFRSIRFWAWICCIYWSLDDSIKIRCG